MNQLRSSHETDKHRRRPTILFVGIGTPWMGGAGFLVRQNMLLHALALLDADVHVALVDSESAAPAPPYQVRVTALSAPPQRKESRWRSLVNDVVCREPMLIRRLDCRALRREVADLHPDQYDAVVAYRCDFAYAAGVLEHRLLVLDIDDPEHLRRAEASRFADDGNAAWQRTLDLKRLKRFEQSCARRAKACFVCHDRDAAPFREIGLQPVVVPNCVEVGERYHDAQRDRSSLLFVGNLMGTESAPNVDAIRWFARDVWPHIRARMPEARCKVAGPIHNRWRQELAAIEGVEILGFVEDLTGVMHAQAAAIAPIRFGTGTRIKILDAMAAGCAVVSTRKGCEGLDVENGQDLLVADSAEDFAAACLSLMHDHTLAARIGRAGWQAVSDRYNRERGARRLADTLSSIIGIETRTAPAIHSPTREVQTTQ